MTMMGKKWIKILLAILLGGLAVASIVFVCILNFKDSSPEELNIKVENGHVIFSTNANSNGFGYTFKFRENNNEYYIKSDQNLLEYDQEVINAGVVVGKTYKVSVAVNREVDAGKSFYSKEVDWKATIYLDAPIISVDSNTLIWDNIDNAEYYDIYYNHNGEMLKIRTTENCYNLEKMQGGRSDIFVLAGSSNDNYLTSLTSNKLKDVDIIHEILPVSSFTFNKTNSILTIYLQEKVEALALYLDEQTYTIVDLVYVGDNCISCNIDYIYSGQKKIGLKPKAVNEYNRCSSNPVYIDVE